MHKIYVAGEFVSTEKKLDVINPFDNSKVSSTFIAGAEELEKAILSAQKASAIMKEMPAYKKYEILMQIAVDINIEKLHLADILAKEAGKPLKYAYGEIDRAVQTFIVAAEEAKRLPAEYLSIDWTPAGEGKEAVVKYFPIGLVAGIAPFNFPLNLAVHKIAPAIAAGNCIILKPARSTPLSTLELARIINKTDLPKGAVSILPMDREAGNQLVTDERFKMLSFTGSPEVGWKMKSQAGNKKVALELGGNAGVIVTKSADIEEAVKRCIIGSYAYQGQVCIHVQRIYVDEDVFDEFADSFVKKVKDIKQGNPLEEDTEITSMIDEENAIRIDNWVADAVQKGAKILTGGKRKGTYYEPTVLTHTNSEMNVCAMEVFGPVVSLEKYTNYEDALQSVNSGRYGLQAGVFTDSIDEMNKAYYLLDVGGVIINDIPTFRVDHMPYGGVKDSGFGREGIKYAIHEMMEPKLLVKNK
ncbi:MAG: aldehyde dehydrogenase [Marinilabiliales bacterium]|nr:MAG: aldehyde dehydrogenase [Marinilabiliales bacterium]